MMLRLFGNVTRCGSSAVRPHYGRFARLTLSQLRCLSDSADPARNIPKDIKVRKTITLPGDAQFISTINPTKLTGEDYVQLTGNAPLTLARKDMTFPDGNPITWKCYYDVDLSRVWPHGTGGFFYLYRPPPGAPACASSIRMRVTNDPDPKSFFTGKDLALKGVPWEAPLIVTPVMLINGLIERDELLSSAEREYVRMLAAVARRFSGEAGTRWKSHHTPVLYRKNQPVFMDLGRLSQAFWIVKSRERDGYVRIQPLEIPLPGVKLQEGEQYQAPRGKPVTYRRLYDGAAVVRLETEVSDNATTLSLRILKVVEPITVRPDAGIELPELNEGSIIPRVDPVTKEVKDSFTTTNHKHSVSLYATLPELPEEEHN